MYRKKKLQTQITRIDTDLEFYDPNSTQGAIFEEVDVEDCSPPVGFDSSIDTEENTKNAEGIFLRKHDDYYLCKIMNRNLYEQIITAYLPNVSDAALRECAHIWDTQLNEALNLSVAKYADKRKTYSKSMGLINRISVASATRNIGYFRYWNDVFRRIGFKMGENLKYVLNDKDTNKSKQYENSVSLLGKRTRKIAFNENVRELTILEFKVKKETNKDYSPGMAIGAGTNPITVEKRCTYFPLCKTKNHTTARSKICEFHDASKDERKIASKRIKMMTRKGNINSE